MSTIVPGMTTTPITEAELDALTVELTAFNSFQAMLDAEGNYRPTIFPRDARHVKLADAYDVAMIGRGDSRRAFRGTRDLRPINVELSRAEVQQLLSFFAEHEGVIIDGGWDDVDSAWTKLSSALVEP